MFVTAANAQEQGEQHSAPLVQDGEEIVLNEEVVALEGEHESVFPPMNAETFPSQILWLAITFGVLYYVLKRVVLPRIGGILENRRDRIALDLEAADRMKTDADEAFAAYEQELAEARERSRAIGNEARDQARADAERERARIEAELDEKLASAEASIGEVKGAALGEIDAVARDVAATIIREVARLDASDDEIARAVGAARG